MTWDNIVPWNYVVRPATGPWRHKYSQSIISMDEVGDTGLKFSCTGENCKLKGVPAKMQINRNLYFTFGCSCILLTKHLKTKPTQGVRVPFPINNKAHLSQYLFVSLFML